MRMRWTRSQLSLLLLAPAHGQYFDAYMDHIPWKPPVFPVETKAGPLTPPLRTFDDWDDTRPAAAGTLTTALYSTGTYESPKAFAVGKRADGRKTAVATGQKYVPHPPESVEVDAADATKGPTMTLQSDGAPRRDAGFDWSDGVVSLEPVTPRPKQPELWQPDWPLPAEPPKPADPNALTVSLRPPRATPDTKVPPAASPATSAPAGGERVASPPITEAEEWGTTGDAAQAASSLPPSAKDEPAVEAPPGASPADAAVERGEPCVSRPAGEWEEAQPCDGPPPDRRPASATGRAAWWPGEKRVLGWRLLALASKARASLAPAADVAAPTTGVAAGRASEEAEWGAPTPAGAERAPPSATDAAVVAVGDLAGPPARGHGLAPGAIGAAYRAEYAAAGE